MTYDRLRDLITEENRFRNDINELYRRIIAGDFGTPEIISFAMSLAERHGLSVSLFPGRVLVFTLKSARAKNPASIVTSLNSGMWNAEAMLAFNLTHARIEVFEDNDYDMAGSRPTTIYRHDPEGGALRK